ncbi:MAG TPA: aminotransferase class V-fold PLP-dependent enzyme [Polyangiaceae bacterium]|nr:aminotransferase class V-fold PLP-dependent enzyme [Polyangiaceae bacterium]
MIHFDHAATRAPRHPAALAAAAEASPLLTPHRGLHAAQGQSQSVVERARQRVAALCPSGVVCFLGGATHALNQAIMGWRPVPTRIALGPMVHNAARRPAIATGAELWSLPSDPEGRIDLAAARREWPTHIDLVVVTHGSNVNGVLQPIAELAEFAQTRGAMTVVDAAQTAGVVDTTQLGPVAAVAFSAHKGVGGLPGVGALVLRRGVQLDPLIRGGVGFDAAEDDVPQQAPHRYEAGTPNLPGIAAFGAAAAHCDPWDHRGAAEALRAAIQSAGYTPRCCDLPVASIDPGMDPRAAEELLERVFGVISRAGLHCAPTAHHTLGTGARGTLRLSSGRSTTAAELERLAEALRGLRAAAAEINDVE